MNILRSLYDIIREITSPPAPDLNVEIVSMRFRLPGDSSMPGSYRIFTQQTTRLVCDLDLRTVRWESTRLYKLVFRCTTEGKVLWEDHHDLRLIGRQHFSLETGWDKPGLRPPGHHKIQLLLDGMEVAHRLIYIQQPPPPPPPIEMLQQPSVKFYACKIAGGFQIWSRPASIRFPKQTTSSVICELTVGNLLSGQQDWTFRVTAQCYTAEDKVLWEDRRDWLITSQTQALLWGNTLSWRLEVGQWTVGLYRLDILIDGKDFAWGAFAIE